MKGKDFVKKNHKKITQLFLFKNKKIKTKNVAKKILKNDNNIKYLKMWTTRATNQLERTYKLTEEAEEKGDVSTMFLNSIIVIIFVKYA